MQWAKPSDPTLFEDVPDKAFWTSQNINGYNDIAVNPATTPEGSTLESAPAGDQINLGDTATFTMQSCTANGTTRSTSNDAYTVTLTCNDSDVCGTETLSTTATHTADGLYSAVLTPTVGGSYDVSISMENAFTSATSSTTVVSNDSTLTVVDDTTVPN